MSTASDYTLIFEVLLRDLADQLEVNGFDTDQLEQAAIDRLRDIFALDREVQWHVFLECTTAADRFAGKAPLPGLDPVRGPDGVVHPF